MEEKKVGIACPTKRANNKLFASLKWWFDYK
jgi:hypothetical protein